MGITSLSIGSSRALAKEVKMSVILEIAMERPASADNKIGEAELVRVLSTVSSKLEGDSGFENSVVISPEGIDCRPSLKLVGEKT